MKNIIALLLLALSPLVISSCGSQPGATTEVQAANLSVPIGTQHVLCGCSSEIGKSCGNYVEVNGDHFPFSMDAGESAKLGAMEWCGVDGAQAEVAGQITEGVFIATTLNKIES